MRGAALAGHLVLLRCPSASPSPPHGASCSCFHHCAAGVPRVSHSGDLALALAQRSPHSEFSSGPLLGTWEPAQVVLSRVFSISTVLSSAFPESPQEVGQERPLSPTPAPPGGCTAVGAQCPGSCPRPRGHFSTCGAGLFLRFCLLSSAYHGFGESSRLQLPGFALDT